MSIPGQSSQNVWVGIDIGGTFTDFVIYSSSDQSLQRFKILSTPADPAEAVLQGLAQLPHHPGRHIVHGSTVATNAILERKGARTALITTKGFRDVLLIGRQNRPELYDLFPVISPPLIPRDWSFEILERVDCEGTILTPLQEQGLVAILEMLRHEAIQSVAVSFLFSFMNPAHEQWVTKRLRDEGFFVTGSSEILPEFREYERTSTTVVNAYVSPVLDTYLGRLEREMKPTEFHIVQSNGGRISVAQARGHGVRSILSGPAGGVVGARYLAGLAGFTRILTYDMGGTSTDVALVHETIHVTTEAQVGGNPIRVPVIDIHTVGAGGGSLATVDAGGNLRVGPQSAGAHPGPVCYGRGGTIPTVTDAHVVLGRLPTDGFLGGRMKLNEESAQQAFDELSRQMVLAPRPGLDARQTLALGMIQIANVHMERALRVISVERGEDPRETVLVAFGGAGGLHACDLARVLGIPHVLVSPMAATLSALGMLAAEVQLDYVQTVMLPGDTPIEILEQSTQPLVDQGQKDLHREGVDPDYWVLSRTVDVRYVGQSFDLAVPLTSLFHEEFHRIHHARYGYSQTETPIEIVNVRVRAVGHVTPPTIPTRPLGSTDPTAALWEDRPVVLPQGMQPVPHYWGTRLCPGHEIHGPAILVLDDTTIYLGPTDHAAIDTYSNILIKVGATDG
ncbi:MAG: hydantoinase/oxoprolinase family protein [Nitrospirales bacterium]|nr:hydantoinase/oxoprolinase family protein [Nitrospirales bacterium]